MEHVDIFLQQKEGFVAYLFDVTCITKDKLFEGGINGMFLHEIYAGGKPTKPFFILI